MRAGSPSLSHAEPTAQTIRANATRPEGRREFGRRELALSVESGGDNAEATLQKHKC